MGVERVTWVLKGGKRRKAYLDILRKPRLFEDGFCKEFQQSWRENSLFPLKGLIQFSSFCGPLIGIGYLQSFGSNKGSLIFHLRLGEPGLFCLTNELLEW